MNKSKKVKLCNEPKKQKKNNNDQREARSHKKKQIKTRNLNGKQKVRK